jgi:transposase-like protein
LPGELQQQVHAVVCQKKQRSGWSVRRTLQHLGVSPASYYRWRQEAARTKQLARPRLV